MRCGASPFPCININPVASPTINSRLEVSERAEPNVFDELVFFIPHRFGSDFLFAWHKGQYHMQEIMTTCLIALPLRSIHLWAIHDGRYQNKECRAARVSVITVGVNLFPPRYICSYTSHSPRMYLPSTPSHLKSDRPSGHHELTKSSQRQLHTIVGCTRVNAMILTMKEGPFSGD